MKKIFLPILALSFSFMLTTGKAQAQHFREKPERMEEVNTALVDWISDGAKYKLSRYSFAMISDVDLINGIIRKMNWDERSIISKSFDVDFIRDRLYTIYEKASAIYSANREVGKKVEVNQQAATGQRDASAI